MSWISLRGEWKKKRSSFSNDTEKPKLFASIIDEYAALAIAETNEKGAFVLPGVIIPKTLDFFVNRNRGRLRNDSASFSSI